MSREIVANRSQLKLFKGRDSRYGGILRNTRKGRAGARPLSTKHSIHLILRSSKASGALSLATKRNAGSVERILNKFAKKYAVTLIKVANVGNHLHIHLRLQVRRYYSPFIRAITSAIAIAITRCSRVNKLESHGLSRFWDYRPYTRFILGMRDWIGVQDYIEINKLEGLGYGRVAAQALVWMSQGRWRSSS